MNSLTIISLRVLFLAGIFVTVVTTHSFGSDIPLCTSVRSAISDEDWKYVVSNYDMVLTLFSPNRNLVAENERVKWIKSLNPEITLIVYGSAINSANFPLHSTGKPREHPDWFLRDESGGFVTDWEYKDALHLDPGNKEWQQYVGETLKAYVNRYGYDGVFIDLLLPTTKYVNFRKDRKAVNPKTGKPYTNSEWKQAGFNLLRTVRGCIGDDKLIIVNGSHGKEYFQTGYSDFLQLADGMFMEGFLGWRLNPQSSNSFETEEEWKADVDAIVDCARQGKIAMVIGNVQQHEGTTPQQYERFYRYITASFLLGMGKRHYVTFFPKVVGRPEQYSRADALPEFCKASLGEPRAEYYRTGGVYQRDFERGKVMVNPSSNKVTVKLDGTWKTAEGESVNSQVTLEPNTGVILIQ